MGALVVLRGMQRADSVNMLNEHVERRSASVTVKK
jgi:hypothetical protein